MFVLINKGSQCVVSAQPLQHSFTLSGHGWKQQSYASDMPNENICSGINQSITDIHHYYLNVRMVCEYSCSICWVCSVSYAVETVRNGNQTHWASDFGLNWCCYYQTTIQVSLFLVILGFILYTNPSFVKVLVFHLPSGHGTKFRWTKTNHHYFGIACCVYEQNSYFSEGVLLVEESKLKCPPLVLIVKISCIWSHWAKDLFSLVSSALRCLPHCLAAQLHES